jgi:hypothetical protein
VFSTPAGIVTLFSSVVCAAAAYNIRPSEIKPTAIANATCTSFFLSYAKYGWNYIIFQTTLVALYDAEY